MKTTKEKIAVMQAFEDGRTIIGCENIEASKESHGDILWDWSSVNYRIKPEPKVIWVNEYDDCSHVHHTEDAARMNYMANANYGKKVLIRPAVKYIEVIDE